jgi:hypothetical protein
MDSESDADTEYDKMDDVADEYSAQSREGPAANALRK